MTIQERIASIITQIVELQVEDQEEQRGAHSEFFNDLSEAVFSLTEAAKRKS